MILEGQLLHALGLACLLLTSVLLLFRTSGHAWAGAFLGLSTGAWLAVGLGLAIFHQVWVWFWWRMGTHLGWASGAFGEGAFRIFAAGFAVGGLGRVAGVVCLGLASQHTLPLAPAIAYGLAVLLLLPAVWLLDSLVRHFGLSRALGADHFFAEYRSTALCRDGIFRYVPHSMYTVGFLSLWAVALAFTSAPALLLAAFNHAYIWVHFFSTEGPDMRRIYG